jgi:hypothetical protein
MYSTPDLGSVWIVLVLSCSLHFITKGIFGSVIDGGTIKNLDEVCDKK